MLTAGSVQCFPPFVSAETVASSGDDPSAERSRLEGHLLRRIRNGERELFDELMRPYRKRLQKLAMLSIRNTADADDAAQMAEIRAFLHIDTFRAECRFSTWLHQIARNEIAHYWRQRVRERARFSPSHADEEMDVETSWPDPGAGPHDVLEQGELARSVRSHVDRLPEHLRCVVELCDLDGRTMANAAARLNLSLAATKTRLHRARRRLSRVAALQDLAARRRSSHHRASRA